MFTDSTSRRKTAITTLLVVGMGAFVVVLLVVGVVAFVVVLRVAVVAVALGTLGLLTRVLGVSCNLLDVAVLAGPAAVLKVAFVGHLLAQVAGVVVLNVGHVLIEWSWFACEGRNPAPTTTTRKKCSFV
jgi:hypothetical protein